MTLQATILVLGLILLVVGADMLVRGGASAARRFGLTPLVIGLTVVAFGTSAPELVVSISGALSGHGDIAVGNVVGSNIFNVGVILGVASMISPIRVKLGLIKLDVPLMIAVSVLAAWLLLYKSISRFGGVMLVLSLVAYTGFSIRLARRQVSSGVNQEFDEGVPRQASSIWLDVFLLTGGLGLLVLGSQTLVKSAVGIARSFDLSEAVIGLTIVAAGTSLPELATSVVAAIRRQSDIALGNIVGSNLFNLLGILGLASVVHPMSAPGIRHVDLWVMVGYSVAVLPLLWTGRKLHRWEGALLLGGYVAYLWIVWPTG